MGLRGFPGGSEETWVWSMGGEKIQDKGMAIHSSILAWRMPWAEEPGGLQSRELQRVRHNWNNFACAHTQSAEMTQRTLRGKNIWILKHDV